MSVRTGTNRLAPSVFVVENGAAVSMLRAETTSDPGLAVILTAAGCRLVDASGPRRSSASKWGSRLTPAGTATFGTRSEG